LATKFTYRITGLAVLLVGMLFFLRDLGVNYIGNTSGFTILIVLLGAGLLAGDFELNRLRNKLKKQAKPQKG
jgi:ABC-type transport system involved in multi-copper enzyme maturation permease subunit